MQRLTTLGAVSISIPNAVQTAQPGALPVTLTLFQVITDATGKQVGHTSQIQQPAIPSDINADVLAALNAQLASVGLVASRVEGSDA